MPTTVPIGVFNIARSEVDREEVKRWTDFIGADEFELPEEESVTNPALLVALAAKRCYKSFQPSLNPNVTRVRKDYAEYLDNILKSGHGSVMEHAVYTFAIENVSRVFTGEMNRHRAGWAISEGSMRYIRYEDIPYWVPTSLKGEDVLPRDTARTIVCDACCAATEGDGVVDLTCDGSIALTIDVKKQLSREVFMVAFAEMESNYSILQTIWADELKPDSKFKDKKQVTSMMRRIIGMGVATGGVWTGNIRALRHVITMRASEAAEEEILHVFTRVAKLLVEKEPSLFGDFEETPEGFWVPKYSKV
jgi:thymidylate synthase (FAD)